MIFGVAKMFSKKSKEAPVLGMMEPILALLNYLQGVYLHTRHNLGFLSPITVSTLSAARCPGSLEAVWPSIWHCSLWLFHGDFYYLRVCKSNVLNVGGAYHPECHC